MLAACASPDVGAFKQSTIALTNGLNENQAKLVTSGEAIVAEFGKPANQPTAALQTELQKMVNNVATLDTQGKQVRAITMVLTSYTSSVARMARAGTDGEEAAEELKSNVESTISTLTGNETILPASINTFAAVIADIVQLGKNKELYEIMGELKTTIDAVAGTLAAISTSEITFIDGLDKFWRTQRPDLENHHIAYAALEKQLKQVDTDPQIAFSLKLRACANDAANCDLDQLSQDRTDIQAAQVAELGKIQAIIEVLQPYEEAYQAWNTKITDWKSGTEKHVKAIPALAAAWQTDHQKIINYLKDCTGMSGVFNKKCGAFSADNLQLLGKIVGGSLLPF